MIIPKPAEQTAEDGAFAFAPDMTVYVSFQADDDYSHFVAEGISQTLREAAGSFVSVKPAGPGETPADAVVLTDHEAPNDLGDEGYELTVRPDRITLRASACAGLFYAAQSLAQLIQHDQSPAGQNDGRPLAQIPCVTIKDKPRFAWRGFMLDSARHFQPVELVMRLIDQMAALKLNRFHWHLTEDQAWRLEVLGYPKLTAVGAWRDNGRGRYGGYYTQEQVREIVAYAKLRQIIVVPEIEMPGHNLAALAAYPQLGCGGGPFEVAKEWGVLDGVFCAGKEQTFTFLNNVLDEVAELFPGPYLHLGGDERKGGLWDSCPQCRGVRQQHGLANESALHRWFMDRMDGYVKNNLGRRSIAWGDNIEAGAPDGQIVHGWHPGQSTLAARLGLDTINSTHTGVYLNYPETEKELAQGLPDWMIHLPLKAVYRYDPIPEDLEPELHHHVIGSEAHLWTEYIETEAQLYHHLSPRLIAFSETVWSPKQRRDFDDFQQRLAVQRAALLPAR